MSATSPLFTDAQFAALLGALATFLGSVLATAKWAVNRAVKTIDEGNAKRDRDFEAITHLRTALVALQGVVTEGRADIGEVRAALLDLRAIAERVVPERVAPERSRPTRARTTNPAGIRAVRPPDDDDR